MWGKCRTGLAEEMSMTLSHAFPIITKYFGQLFLQTDHICSERKPHARPCPFHSDSAIYTEMDAMLDNAKRLADRLARGGTLKPVAGT